MLVGTGQLIKQCRLSTVLIACKSKRKQFSFWDHIPPLLHMIDSHLTKSRMQRWFILLSIVRYIVLFPLCVGNLHDLDFLRFRYTKGQFVAPDTKFNWIAHRCGFHICDLCSRNNSHIQEMLTKCTLSAYCTDFRTLSLFQLC